MWSIRGDLSLDSNRLGLDLAARSNRHTLDLVARSNRHTLDLVAEWSLNGHASVMIASAHSPGIPIDCPREFTHLCLLPPSQGVFWWVLSPMRTPSRVGPESRLPGPEEGRSPDEGWQGGA